MSDQEKRGRAVEERERLLRRIKENVPGLERVLLPRTTKGQSALVRDERWYPDLLKYSGAETLGELAKQIREKDVIIYLLAGVGSRWEGEVATGKYRRVLEELKMATEVGESRMRALGQVGNLMEPVREGLSYARRTVEMGCRVARRGVVVYGGSNESEAERNLTMIKSELAGIEGELVYVWQRPNEKLGKQAGHGDAVRQAFEDTEVEKMLADSEGGNITALFGTTSYSERTLLLTMMLLRALNTGKLAEQLRVGFLWPATYLTESRYLLKHDVVGIPTGTEHAKMQGKDVVEGWSNVGIWTGTREWWRSVQARYEKEYRRGWYDPSDPAKPGYGELAMDHYVHDSLSRQLGEDGIALPYVLTPPIASIEEISKDMKVPSQVEGNAEYLSRLEKEDSSWRLSNIRE